MSTGNQAGTLEAVAVQVASLLRPLSDRLAHGEALALLADLGYGFPPELAANPAFIAALDTTTSAGREVSAAASSVVAASDADDRLGLATAVVELLTAIAHLLDAIDALVPPLAGAAGALTQLTPAEIAELTADLAKRVVQHTVVTAIEDNVPELAGALDLAGVIERTDERLNSTDPLRPPFTRVSLRLDRLPLLVTAPATLARDLYGWGTPGFDGDALFSRMASVLSRAGFPAVYDRASTPPVLELVVVEARVAPSVPEPGIGLRLHTAVGEDFEQDGGAGLRASATVRVRGPEGSDLVVTPDGTMRLSAPGSSTTQGEFRLRIDFTSDNDPAVVVGEQGGTRVQIHRAWIEGGALLAWTPGQGASLGTLKIAGAIEGEVVTASPDGDGFLSAILPAGGGRCSFSLEGGLARSGFYFQGSAGLAITIPVDRELGPVRFEQVLLSLRADGGALVAEIGTALRVRLGPVQVFLDRVGLRAVASFPTERGNLGPVDLSAGFLPPSGAGILLDASPITGGGFVRYDDTTGRYAGMLKLSAGTIGITAFGLLDTRLPPGEGGYALLLALSATFPAVQVGFGFALTGVGGLLAVNRRVNVDVLRGRLAAGTAGRFLAPQDPVRDVPALLADLDAVFPSAPGITVVGPTVQLLWAGLVHLDVGVFIELPGPARVVLLGSAHAEIERDGRAYLRIRVDIVGVVDLRAETAAFDAVLIDSHLMGMLDLTGGAAFRLSWGAQPYAVLSLGGFNPAYHPEPLSFPATLTRIAMVHGTPGDELYLRFEGYFAITSNTLQFGASVEAVIHSGDFTVHGTVGFDALIQFIPFHFQFDIRASVSVAYKGHTLGGLTLTGSLTGPGPVVLQAKVCIELLFFDICYSGTFPLGPSTPPVVPVVADLLDTLLTELTNPARLRAAGAPDPYVRLQPPDPSLTTPVIPPAGTLAWEQQRAPLDVLLTRVGGTPLPAPAQVSASSAAPSTAQSDWFAPGQFTDLTDDQALTRPAFERLTGGLRLAGADVVDGPGAQRTLTTRQIRLPAPATSPSKPVIMFPAWIVTSAAGPAAPAIAIRTESWIVTSPAGERSDLTGAQARQLATLTTSARAIPAADRLAAFTF